jgi:16S rRNA (cytosine967-C5)-methyltransferase
MPDMVEIQRLAAAAVGRVLSGRSLDASPGTVRFEPEQGAARERAAIQDLAYGTLRFLGRLEALLEALLDRPLRDGRLRALLLVALYQLEHGRGGPHAVVDHAVRTCGRIGLTSAGGLANAVLRNYLRRRAELGARVERLETARYSHPQWWIDRLRADYPHRYAAALEVANLHPPLALRVNRRRLARADYLSLLAQEGLAAEAHGEAGVVLATPLPAQRIPGFADGLVSVQDVGAQLAAPLLDIRDGMRVLDACAAPGGKSTHLLELADVALLALDSDARRLERVHSNLARLGLSAQVVCGDAGRPDTWWDGQPFERILLDVPCSASGVARRHPDIKWLRRETDIARFAQRQEQLLGALWQLLAGDGKLLYATCSVFREENDQQMARFVAQHRDAKRVTLPAVDNDPQLPAGQLLPDRRHDGFYYALVQKA